LRKKEFNSLYEIDPTSNYLLLNSRVEHVLKGLLAQNYRFPIETIFNEYCDQDKIFILPKNEKIGVMPREDSKCFITQEFGGGEYVLHYVERIGLGLLNTDKVINLNINKKKRKVGLSKYAFMSGGIDNLKRVKNEWWLKNDEYIKDDLDSILFKAINYE